MTSADKNSFLKALDALEQDCLCRICKEFCKKPVMFKCCFHYFCEAHVPDLVECPTCYVPLLDKPVFKDDKLEIIVNSVLELKKIFSPYQTDPSPVHISNEDAKNVTVRMSKQRSAKNLATNNHIGKVNSETESKKVAEAEIPNTSQPATVSSSKVTKTIDKRNKKGETTLHAFCRLGKINKVIELLNEGANMNTKDNAGWTPLHEAVQSGRLDLVRLLLQHKSLVNVPGPDNETPLHEAVRYNYKDIVIELVTHGADLYAKNSIGEIPLQLASSEIKKILETTAENVIHTQTADLNRISSIQIELDFDNIRVYCVTRFRTVQNKLKTLAKHHTNIRIESKFTKKVSHLLIDAEDGVCLPSLDVLQGIVYGIWILSTDWIIKCTASNIEVFSNYEIKGVGTTSNGPKNSRINKYKQRPGIFNGCHFYLHNFNTNYEVSNSLILNKTILSKLLTDAGGIVLRRIPNPELIPEEERLVPYHAKKGGKLEICSHYIIFKDSYTPMYNMRHLKALPITWLLECIEKYELCEPE